MEKIEKDIEDKVNIIVELVLENFKKLFFKVGKSDDNIFIDIVDDIEVYIEMD